MFPRFSIERQRITSDEVAESAGIPAPVRPDSVATSASVSTLYSLPQVHPDTRSRTASASVTSSILLKMSLDNLTLDMKISSKSRKQNTSDLFEGELYPHQRLRNGIAILIMLLVHALVIYTFMHQKAVPIVVQGQEEGQLVFIDDKPAQVAEAPLVAPQPVRTHPPKAQPLKTPRRASSSRAITPPATAQQPLSPPTSSPLAAPVEDTSSRLAAARERRRALDSAAAEENRAAAQASREPSDDDIASANIARNLQNALHPRKGMGGAFQVTNTGARMGQFVFRGWADDPSHSVHETYDVDAGLGGNVELAMIRKMIALIRKHYPGDFIWENRQGERKTLSARPGDNAFLEEYLMREFFK